MLFGDAAERRGLVQPERLVREVKRRVGDEVPVNVGGRTFAPEDLLALLVDWVSTVATERFGRLPSSVVVTVPVAWGTYRTDLIRAALVRAGIGQVEIIAEPVAAARHYEATNPLAPGSTLAVYDFGGGTFDAVLLRKTASGSLTIIGSPTGIEDLGGADFDDAVLRHVLSAARLDVTTLLGDADARVALAGLRRECVEAKEALSFDSEATVPVLLGGTSTAVRLTRDEFEAMIENDIERTIEVLGDAMEAAAVEASDLDAILLTGGSSRIPRVAQLLSERFDRPIAVDTDPKAVIALGAALEAADAAIVSAADAAAETEASEAAAAAAEDEAPPARPRRPWLRRVPAAAYVSGGAVALAAVVAVSGAAAVYAPEVFGGNAQLASENGLDRGGYSIGAPLPTSDALAAPLRIDGALFTGDTTDAEKKAEAAKPVVKVEVPAPLAPVVESPFRRVDPPRERANPRATPFQGRGVTPSAAPRGGSSSSPSKSPSSQPTKKPSASASPKPSNPGTPPPSQTSTPVPPAETPPPAETTAPVVPDPPAETTAPVVPDPPAETTAPVEPEAPAETTPPVEPEPEPSGTPGAE
ncbi:Hsp70 family protein [Microbacterium aurantiacum]|uniref:Hsp70 family protein n=2 Tax=Microbacterium aurantiacum TaxID=162393 RepID=UPI0040374A06